jgi:hypothetical protein
VLRVPFVLAVFRLFSIAGDAVASGDARFWGLDRADATRPSPASPWEESA